MSQEGPSYEKEPLRSTGPDPNCTYIVTKPCFKNEESSKTAVLGSIVTVTVERPGAPPQTLSFLVGHSLAVPWLDEVVVGLQVYQTVTLSVDGSIGSQDVQVTLDALSEPCATVDSDFQDAQSLRQNTNDLFKKAEKYRDYSKVRLLYNRALSITSDEDKQFRAAIRANLALVALRMREWYPAIINADGADVLLEAPSTKPGFRRSSAFNELGFHLRALADILAVSQLDPNNVTIHRQQEYLNEKTIKTLTKHRQEFAEVYSVFPQNPLFKTPLLK